MNKTQTYMDILEEAFKNYYNLESGIVCGYGVQTQKVTLQELFYMFLKDVEIKNKSAEQVLNEWITFVGFVSEEEFQSIGGK